MGRPTHDHETRTRRGLRDMAGGTLDGMLEIPAPVGPTATPIRLSRLGGPRLPPEPETCLRPYDDYGHAPHTSSHTVLADGTVLASMVRSGEIRTARYTSGITSFLDGDEDADSVTVVGSGFRTGHESSLRPEWDPVATVSQAGGRTWLCISWMRVNVNADGDDQVATQLLETTDGGASWSKVADLVNLVYDPDPLIGDEFRPTPNAGKVLALASGRLVVMGARWYVRGGGWVANHWGVWASDDGGDTWAEKRRFENGPAGGPYTNAMSRNMTVFGGRLWAFTSDDYGSADNRLHYSEDDGETWTTAWNSWTLPFSGDKFFGMAPLAAGGTMVGFFRNFSSPSGLIHVAVSDTPADFGSWRKVDEAHCDEHHLDYHAYDADGRQWVEVNGTLITEYLPG